MKKSLADLLDPAQAAVIVVDVQNDFCRPEGACGQAGRDTSEAMAMLPRLQALLDAARRAGAKVIFIQTIHTEETDAASWIGRHETPTPVCRKGTWGGEFTEVAPRPGEPVVNKHRYSAFIHTPLESVLHTLGVRTLVMTGVATNVCVESTARDGFMLDYNVVFVGDCTAAYDPKLHEGALENMRRHFGVVVDHDAVVAHWLGARVPAGV